MSIPTMDDLRGQYAQEPFRYAKELFDLEVAFYHGYMAALVAMEGNLRACNVEHPDVDNIIANMKDIANAEMAAEVGA